MQDPKHDLDSDPHHWLYISHRIFTPRSSIWFSFGLPWRSLKSIARSGFLSGLLDVLNIFPNIKKVLAFRQNYLCGFHLRACPCTISQLHKFIELQSINVNHDPFPGIKSPRIELSHYYSPHIQYCRGLTRAYIDCIEHLGTLRLSGDSNLGPPALQASTL